MRRAVEFLWARLREPGTMRSVIWIVIGVATGARAETLVEDAAALALIVLGAISAAMEKPKPVVAVVVEAPKP